MEAAHRFFEPHNGEEIKGRRIRVWESGSVSIGCDRITERNIRDFSVCGEKFILEYSDGWYIHGIEGSFSGVLSYKDLKTKLAEISSENKKLRERVESFKKLSTANLTDKMVFDKAESLAREVAELKIKNEEAMSLATKYEAEVFVLKKRGFWARVFNR